MKKTIGTAFVLSAITSLSAAQSKETPLLIVGNQTISVEEFEFIYNKNNSVAQIPISKTEYLDLFEAYKLKAAEGRSLSLDTTTQYRNECDYYFNELAPAYQTDTIAQKKAEEQLKERLKQEITASHILIKVAPNASPADTIRAYNTALSARNEIVSGANFADVAKRLSDDPSAKRNSGYLGSFSALQMVEPFETMAYKTPIGEVSDIFRTQFGYHIMIVHSRTPYPPQMQVAHIMKQFGRNNTPSAVDSLKNITDSLYQLIANGADFATLATTNSDDKQSASHDGLMPWFTQNNIPKELEPFGTEAFALHTDGDISGVFKTKYGFHILKRIAYKAERTDEDIEEMISYAKRHNAPIATAGQEAYTLHLLTEYNLVWNEATKQQVETILSANTADAKEQLSVISQPLATYHNNQCIMPSDPVVMQYWNKNNTPQTNFNNIAKHALLTYDKTQLTLKYADLRYTMQEYYDGLLVFEVNKRTIWNSANTDSTELIALYNSNLSRYTKGSTFDGNIYICSSKKIAQKVAKTAVANPTKASQMALHTISGQQTQGGAFDDVLWPNIKSEYIVVSGTYTNGEQLPFESVRGLVASDLQQIKETKYIEQLKLKYKPKRVGKIK